MPAETFSIAGRAIGGRAPCFIIAEAGVNHNGSLAIARRLVDVAAEAGADAVKFQTFKADALATAEAPKASYQTRTTDARESQLDMLRRLELAPEDFGALRDHARDAGIAFLSTPFDEESADLLEDLGVPAFKVPSGELTNTPFLEHLARKQRPMIVSTGMATLQEVAAATQALERTGLEEYALLQCTSNYPADPRDINLRAMATMRDTFRCPVGYSDHTLGIDIALAAIALGASVVEKHFTTDSCLPGPDHAASLEPPALAQLVRSVRAVEAALGDGVKAPAPAELDTARAARKSLVAARNLLAGTLLSPDMLTAKRPGSGLPPSSLPDVLGRRLRADLAAGELLSWEVVE